MTKEQFSTLLQTPTIINLNLVAELEDIANRFPYFQNAHLLLAKQYHGHENIRYESYLRKASAYAPDRVRLYNLIKESPARIIHINEEVNINAPIRHEEITAPAATITEASVKDVEEVTITKVEEKTTAPIEVPEAEKADPRLVIEQRLKEIQGEGEIKNEEVKEEKQIDPPVAEKNKIGDLSIDEIEINNTVEPSLESKSDDVLDTPIQSLKEEELTESAEEKSTPNQLQNFQTIEIIPINTPSLEKNKVEVAPRSKSVDEAEKHSFAEWLKIKNIPIAVPENLINIVGYSIDSFNRNTAEIFDDKGNLLDKFIKTEPRIVPARSEFYSPGNMARKSAIEHEDLITETLARIYAQQGNIRKAIEAYERLSLKLPEKSSYFAALILELQEKES